MVTHRRLAIKDGADFYVTPEWATRALLAHETFQGVILEPCCGNGAISQVLAAAGHTVCSSDLFDRGFGEVRDFFDYRGPLDNVVTNPPYNIAEDVLEHALKLTRGKVALLLRLAFLEGQERWRKFYGAGLAPARVLVFARRLSVYYAGVERTEGGTTSYMWAVWDMQSSVNETRIVWMPPNMGREGA